VHLDAHSHCGATPRPASHGAVEEPHAHALHAPRGDALWASVYAIRGSLLPPPAHSLTDATGAGYRAVDINRRGGSEPLTIRILPRTVPARNWSSPTDPPRRALDPPSTPQRVPATSPPQNPASPFGIGRIADGEPSAAGKWVLSSRFRCAVQAPAARAADTQIGRYTGRSVPNRTPGPA
jgi:hypothetical protein